MGMSWASVATIESNKTMKNKNRDKITAGEKSETMVIAGNVTAHTPGDEIIFQDFKRPVRRFA
jgi:hypothetical protein